ncbi:MAG: hypothetical protein QMC81_08310 [Thermoanaerobacterales bacterium]|nr:hypothetical protein [Bacillota bacterium]MDI6907472.1 hypothetical protein [Thermoanaerobacterales bacterium]
MFPFLLVVYGWFECLALVLLVLALLGIPWISSRVALIATLQCIGVGVLRSLPLAFEAHAVLGVILLALLVAWVFRVPAGRSLVAGVGAMALLVAVEFGVIAAVHPFFDPAMNPFIWLLTGLPQVFVLVTLAFAARKRGIVLFR